MEENVEKIDPKKLRPLENFEDDFSEYFVNRMSPNCLDDDKALTKELVWNAFHILVNFDFRETIGFMTNVSDILDEFQEKFGDRYDNACEDCREKLDKGEIKETPKNDCNGGCGGCQ